MSLLRDYGPEDVVMIPDTGPIGLCISELEEIRSDYGIVFEKARTNYDYYDGYDMAEVNFGSDKYEIEIGYSNLFTSNFRYSVTLSVYEKTHDTQKKVDVLKYLDEKFAQLYQSIFKEISKHSELRNAMRNAALVAKEIIIKLESNS